MRANSERVSCPLCHKLNRSSSEGSVTQPQFEPVRRKEGWKSVSPLNGCRRVVGKNFSETDGLGLFKTAQSVYPYESKGVARGIGAST